MNRADKYSAAARQAAIAIRLLILDVDGVLTDGGVYYDQEGRISKRFDIQDGLGIKLMQSVGLEVAVVSGVVSPAVEKRVRELGIAEYRAGHLHKVVTLESLVVARGLTLAQVAFLGDDWVDAAAMRVSGLPMAVSNAQPEILALALWVSRARGGHGAVREAVRFILEAQGRLEALWQCWGQ
ncbi:3-deoxy-D-manno-octulosonate 8-phosphate phosphatase KdsC [Desulfovibrionales bacterium]